MQGFEGERISVQVGIVWIVVHEHLGEGVIHGVRIPHHDLTLLGQIILNGACAGTKTEGQEGKAKNGEKAESLHETVRGGGPVGPFWNAEVRSRGGSRQRDCG